MIDSVINTRYIANIVDRNHEHVLRDAYNMLNQLNIPKSQFLTHYIFYNNMGNAVKAPMLILPTELYTVLLMQYFKADVTDQPGREKHTLDEIERQNNITIIRQYIIGDYRLDGYCIETNTAYEVDEAHHRYRKKQDKDREIAVARLLPGCKFVRVPVSNTYKNTKDIKQLFDSMLSLVPGVCPMSSLDIVNTLKNKLGVMKDHCHVLRDIDKQFEDLNEDPTPFQGMAPYVVNNAQRERRIYNLPKANVLLLISSYVPTVRLGMLRLWNKPTFYDIPITNINLSIRRFPMYTLSATNLATYPVLSTLTLESLSGLSHNRVMTEIHDMFRELGHDIRLYLQYVTVRRNNMDMTVESLTLPPQYVLTWASKHDDKLRLRIILELAQKTSEMLQAVPVTVLEQMVSNGNIRVWFSKENVDKSLAVFDLENLLVTKSQYGKSVASTVLAELLGMNHSQLMAGIRKMFTNVGLDGNHNLIAVEGKQMYALTRELALFVITKYSTVTRFTVVCKWLELVSGNANLFRILEDAMFEDGWGIEIGTV